MLPGNQSASPARTYRRIRATRKYAKRKDSSSASSSSDDENEERALLKTHDRRVDRLQIVSDQYDSEDNIYSRNYDSHRARRKTICHQPDSRARVDSVKPRYHHENKFETKRLPRYKKISRKILLNNTNEILERDKKLLLIHSCYMCYRYLQSISRDTAYFEVNENEDSQSKRRCVVRTEDRIINTLSDARILVDSQKTNDKWSVSSKSKL